MDEERKDWKQFLGISFVVSYKDKDFLTPKKDFILYNKGPKSIFFREFKSFDVLDSENKSILRKGLMFCFLEDDEIFTVDAIENALKTRCERDHMSLIEIPSMEPFYENKAIGYHLERVYGKPLELKKI